ncbi:MAG: hypothetical protein HC806_05590 [Anaerolineae bacterium]|nr:hypothetical protein [Anaerolineae bacterium]
MLSVCAISLIWLFVLPWIARRPAVETHLRDLDSQGIDPSAMYYTDLKMMDRLLRRLEGRKSSESQD